jgi:hypothetical protein
MTYPGMSGDEKEYLSCPGKYICLYKRWNLRVQVPNFIHNKAELELEIGKYKAKKAEDVIRSMKRRYSIE